MKPLFYVSTNGVFPMPADGAASAPVCLENDWEDGAVGTEESWRRLADGYSQSKWVAEALCREARAKGLAVAVVRPGNMAWSAESGAWNDGDFMCV